MLPARLDRQGPLSGARTRTGSAPLAALVCGLLVVAGLAGCGGKAEPDPNAKPIPIRANLSEYKLFKDYTAPGRARSLWTVVWSMI